MVKRLLKTFMAVLAIAAAAAGPVRGQDSYNVTFGGFDAPEMNTTVSVTSLPQTFTQIGVNNFYPWMVISNGSDFISASVTSGGNDKVSVAIINDNDNNVLSITVTGTFEGTATIHVVGANYYENAISRDITVACTLPPQPHTVRMAKGTEEAANWTLASGNASVPGTQALENVMSGSTLTATYAGDLKVKEVIATKHQEPNEIPLTIEALTAGTVKVEHPRSGMQYTLNGGPKTAMTEASTVITVAVGDKVQLYGDGTSITSYDGTGIGGGYEGTAEVKVYGNIMSLVNETGFDTATTLTANGAFNYLFVSYINLKDISGLKLPATTLTQSCYYGMFSYCTGLTTVPSDLLPATTMARECYASMFYGCENLTNVPTLPATTLAVGCYNSMFSYCISLTTVPSDLLPATTLAEACYSSMFLNCRNLTTAPVLPATTLAARCYYSMFQACQNLAASPVLPATTLVERCYNYMFANCYNLRSVTCLATSGINQNYSTTTWLNGAGESVQGTKIFNAVSTAEWPEGSSNGIPIGWTRQNIDN